MVEHAFTPVAGIGLILLLAVIPWHLRAKNVAVILLCIWLGTDALCLFINSIIWWDNVDIKAKIWCDISTKVVYSGLIGPVCCCFCILRRLEAIASTRVAQTTVRDRRSQLIWDISVGLVVPVVFTGLQIVNQGHRFDIVEGIGCVPVVYYTPVAVVLNLIPPLLFSVLAVVYGALALRWFVIRRRQLNAVLHASGSQMDRSRYLRLMAMAGCEAFVSFPINVATFVSKFQYTGKLSPWISWSDTHYDFGRIGQTTAAWYQESPDRRKYWHILELGRWGIIIGCYFIFFFFGTTKEATQAYAKLLRPFRERVSWALARQPRGSEGTVGHQVVAIQTAWQVESDNPSLKLGASDDDFRFAKSTISNPDKV